MADSKWYIDFYRQFFTDKNNDDFKEEILNISTESINPPNNHADDVEVINPDEKTSEIPTELPILPLRGIVVYPETGVPLTVGQQRSIRLVDEAVANKRLIGLVSSKNPDID